jgi:hypothetical protein
MSEHDLAETSKHDFCQRLYPLDEAVGRLDDIRDGVSGLYKVLWRIEGELVEMRLRLWLFSLAQVGLLALIAWQLYHHWRLGLMP